MILLTGGTGFAGRHIARRLVADGWQVRVLSRSPGRVALPDAVLWSRGDLSDPESLRAALGGVDVVVHAGAELGSGGRDSDLERVNAHGTASLARAAREAGVRQFLHVSSAGVYGDGTTPSPHVETDAPAPQSAYERSKLAAERGLVGALQGSDVGWTILRPSGLYGADRPATAALFREVALRRLWLHGPARVILHPTHVDDLVAAIGLALGRTDLRGEIINVGGERWLEHSEFLALVGARVGKAPLQWRPPQWTASAAALAVRAWSVLGEPPGSLARVSRTWINRSVDTGKARRQLGFEPVKLAWGLDQTMAELRAPQPEPGARPLSDTPPRRS